MLGVFLRLAFLHWYQAAVVGSLTHHNSTALWTQKSWLGLTAVGKNLRKPTWNMGNWFEEENVKKSKAIILHW